MTETNVELDKIGASPIDAKQTEQNLNKIKVSRYNT